MDRKDQIAVVVCLYFYFMDKLGNLALVYFYIYVFAIFIKDPLRH